MNKYLLTFLCLLTIFVSYGQQISFEQVFLPPPAPQGNPVFEGVRNSSIAFADVDGDNDQDVLITGLNSSKVRTATLYTNNGSGIFTEVTGTPFEEVHLSSIAFADVDGDNDEDVLITGLNSAAERIAKLYTNNGSGIFTEVTGTPFEEVLSGSIAFADVDGDNDEDVLITGQNSSLERIAKLYTNNGSGIFTEVTGTLFDGVRTSSIAFADVDGDSDQDVLITGINSSDELIAKLYTNNGSGVFTKATGTPFEGVRSGSIAFADVDGDSDQDVLITGLNSSNGQIAKLYTNNGSGIFTEATGTPFNGVFLSSIAFSDVDGDSNQDVLITGQNSSDERIATLYTNNGSGVFTKVTSTPFDGVASSSIAFADIDGDSDQDVLITGLNISNGAIATLYRNTTPSEPIVTTSAASSLSAISAILNGSVSSDGDVSITERGFVYSLTADDSSPTVAESSGTNVTKVVVTGTTGDFSTLIEGLMASSDYSFAAYATNSVGTTDGSVLTFTTPALTIPTLTFTDIDKIYGDEDFTLSASSNSAGEITYSIEGAANGTSLSGTNNEVVTLGNAGTVTIGATQAADGIYSATTKDITLSVAPKAITVTVDDQQMTYGDALPTLTQTITGFVNGEDKTVLDVLPTVSTTAIASSDAGSYPINVSVGSDNNYSFSYTDGTLLINKATLTATADDNSKVYGETNPAFTFTYAGFVNAEDATVLDNEPVPTSTADQSSDVGSYPISFTTGADNNYDITTVDGTLTVTKAPLSATADDQSRTYGAADPVLTISYFSFVNGDDAADITAPAAGTTTDASSAVGNYPIELTGGAAANYSITLTNGNLEIMPAALSVTADDQTITYGDALPALIQTITGFVNGEDETALDAVPAVATTAIASSDAGSYTISSSAGSDNNYTFNYTDGTLLINKAEQTITIEPIADKEVNQTPVEVTASSDRGLELTYEVSGPATIEGNIINLNGNEGIVIVTVSQSGNQNYNAASASESFAVSDPCINFSAEVVTTNLLCNNDESGVIEVLASGTGPFSYSLNGQSDQESNVFDELAAGEYEVTVTDASDCSTILLATITQPDALTITAETEESTNIDGNGSIEVSVTGGTGAYTYEWSSGETTSMISDLEIGEYEVVVTDENNCSANALFTVGGVTSNKEEVEDDRLRLYPNPVTHYFNIQFTDDAEYVKMYDVFGKLVLSENIESKNQKFNVENFSAGVYFVQVKANGKLYRLVKK